MSSPALDQKGSGLLVMRLVQRLHFCRGFLALFCSSFYVYFVCFLPLGLQLNSPAFLENYLLAWKIRKSSGKDKEKLTPPGDKESARGVFYLLRISGLSCQVTAADKLRNLNSASVIAETEQKREVTSYAALLTPALHHAAGKDKRKPAPGNRHSSTWQPLPLWLHRHLAWFGMTWPDCLELIVSWWSLPGAGRHRYLPQPYREGPAIY